jgi:site-specific recombinase XerD
MATVDKRTTSKGRTSYRVRWREGGTRDGDWQSATFTRSGEAQRFKNLVEAAGHKWPTETTGAASIPGTLTVAELADRFLEDKAKRVRSDRTVADYRRDVDNWITPTFGTRQAGTITEAEIQAWVDGMVGKGLSPKSACDRHAILSGMFKFAAAPSRRLVDRNPCESTDLPKKQKTAPKGLMPNEWTALHRALTTIDQAAADVAEALLATGWRWSEVTAMTTWDVEDYGQGGPLFVTMGHVVRRNAAGQHVIVEEGKGQASVRRIQVDPGAAVMFRRRLEHTEPGGLVFTTARHEPGGIGGKLNGLGGSQWHYSNYRNRFWNPAVKAANLTRKPTPHWLRHTHVVWMARSGAALPELQSRIGHASITTTINVYGRMLTDVQPEALGAFAAMRDGGHTLAQPAAPAYIQPSTT